MEVSGHVQILATLPQERTPINHSLGAWVGHIASLDIRREKFLRLRMWKHVEKHP
jgi:hypothetical protein